MNNKENAYQDWMNRSFFKAQTWRKLTEAEQGKFLKQLDHWCNECGMLTGTYSYRWKILAELYYMYLLGLGYTPEGWRD